jgi:LPS-assembly protein
MKRPVIPLLLLLPWATVTAQGEPPAGPWQLCAADELAQFIRPATGAPPDSPIQILADEGLATLEEAQLEGDVQVDQGDRRLRASEVFMDRTANRVRGSGGVTYGDPQLALRSREAELDLTGETGVFTGAEYYLPSINAQGSAAQVTVERGTRRSFLSEVTYSTCVRGDEFWQLRTGTMKLNEETGRGSARDITLAIKGVPVMYFPYLSFPINDERQSGFLIPTGGYNDDSGVDVRIPYYWNIAPNQDMTVAPRVLSKRGVQLGLEYRFLRPRDRGEIRLEYLPDDRVFGDSRDAVFAAYRANPLPKLYADLLVQNVSDDEYLDDLENNLDLLSTASLERHLDFTYYGGEWLALLRAQDYQTIDNAVFADPDDDPYSRMPQFLFDGNWRRRLGGFDYKLRGEWVRFDHDSAVTGDRLDVEPGVSLPLTSSAGFLVPTLSYRYTTYNLRDNAAGTDANPTRGAPIASLDAGLFFERPVQSNWWYGSGLMTLEPRLFYLYVPFRDQSDIPVFDSTEVDRGYPWLFLDNRFTGADRLGDANQLTTALTTRFLSTTDGREQWRASIGQIHYFQDREVTLENTAPEDSSRSELIAETLVNLGPSLTLRGALQWDVDRDETRRGAFDIRYHPDSDRLFNLSHRFAAGDLEQVDVAMAWPLQAQWRTVARWNYSLKEDRNLDLFAGFEYQECCWALRMLARQRRNNPEDEEASNSILVELELKGLAGIGSDINDILEKAILGYEDNRRY